MSTVLTERIRAGQLSIVVTNARDKQLTGGKISEVSAPGRWALLLLACGVT